MTRTISPLFIQLICLSAFSQNTCIEQFPGIDTAWNHERIKEKLGSFTGRGSVHTGTSSALEFCDYYAFGGSPKLGYHFPVVSNYLTKHTGENNWDAWKNSFNNLADPNGTGSSNLGRIIRAGKASAMMISVPLVLGPKKTDNFLVDPAEAADVSRRYDKVLSGDYDEHYRWLTDRLFHFGYQDKEVVLRINHEMTNPQYTYCCMNAGGYDNQAKHKLVWRHAVDVMRYHADEVHGGWPSTWLLDFNPQSKADQHAGDWDSWVLSFYPGDAVDTLDRPYVDIASIDIYDRFGRDNIDKFFERYRIFVNARDVWAGVDEWGLWETVTGPSGPGQSGGDNPDFINWFVDGLFQLPPSKVKYIVLQGAQSNHDWFNPLYKQGKNRFFELFGEGAKIIVQPVDREICESDPANFTVTATGSSMEYQWQVRWGDQWIDMTDTLPFSGTRTAALFIDKAPLDFHGSEFRCRVHGPCLTDTTDTVSLLVSPGARAAFEFSVDSTTVQFVNQSLEAGNYNWSFGDLSYSNEENPIHTYPEAGIYVVTLVATNHCGPDTAIQEVVINSTRLSEPSAGPVQIYPNPSDGRFRIDFSSADPHRVVLKVVSMDGQLVYQKESSCFHEKLTSEIDLGNTCKGIHLLYLFSGDKTYLKRIITL